MEGQLRGLSLSQIPQQAGPAVTVEKPPTSPPAKMPGVPLLRLSIPDSGLKQQYLTPHYVGRDPSLSPLSESPETPTSTSSPITGVVDLTKYIRTLSTSVAAHGGLSDIYQGEKSGGPSVGDEIASNKPVLVAIKVLRIFSSKDRDDDRARKRLNREVYVWHRLEHPNVVKLFGTSYHMAGRPSMIMQWYGNGNAAEYLSKKNPLADRGQLVLDVAKGLEYIHTRRPPIVHGDLKGNNVLISDDGHAVLCDFGLSKVMEELGQPTGFTVSHHAAGPIRWQAPELMEDDDAELSLVTDIWSFGCTAFEILSSVIPYAHRTKDALVIRDMQKGLKPCTQHEHLLVKYPPSIQNVLDSVWSFSPEARPAMSEIVQKLQTPKN